MQYTDAATVENYLTVDIDASFSAQITAWITAMSRFMDESAGRVLVNNTETARKYDGSGEATQMIDATNTITAVTVDGTAVTYLMYPANADYTYQLALESGVFTSGLQNVEVTGKLGLFNTLPEDIKYACTVLVAGIVNNSMGRKDDVASETVGKYSVSYKSSKEKLDYAQALEIIQRYKKITV